MWWKSRDVSVRVETWLLPERLSASDIRRWCSYTRRIRRKRYFLIFGDQNSLQLLHQEDVKCTFFAPGGWRNCTTTLHFLGKFFVDFNRTTFISSCFRGGWGVGYALALTGSGPSFMFPHRNIVVCFSVSLQSNVFTFQPASTKAKVEDKYLPKGKLKDLRFWGAKFSASKTFVFFCPC